MTTYYVAKNGNDINSGTEASPWLTIQKAANMAIAGDIVYVKSGTYTERITFPNSGNATNYITFQNFGTDTVNLRPPDGVYSRQPGQPFHAVIQIYGKSYIKVKGFNFTDPVGATSDTDGNIAVSVGAHHIIIDGNRFVTTKMGSIIRAGYHPAFPGGVQDKYSAWNIDFTNNYVNRNSIDLSYYTEGISFDNVDYADISYNYIDHYEIGECIDVKGGTGPADHATISNNFIKDVFMTEAIGVPPKIQGQGIYLANMAEPGGWGKVFNNITTNTKGIHIGSEEGGLAHDHEIFNNIIYNCVGYVGIGQVNYAAPGFTPQYQNNHFYNNVAYNSKSGFVSTVAGPGTIFRNNIALAGPDWSTPFQLNTGYTQDHNSWNVFPGQDPQFVSASGHDFHLKSTSPARDTGTCVGAPNYDIEGNTRPQGSGCDIGAYEYTTISVCPQIFQFINLTI